MDFVFSIYPETSLLPTELQIMEKSVLAERLQSIQEFLLICDQFKKIERRTYLVDGSRRETDAEHTWHMALYAVLLQDEIGAQVDLARTLTLILVHDLVEIHAGDTFAYDQAAREDQSTREIEAANTLFSVLPPDLCKKMHAWWTEFEVGATREARFARALDRLQGFAQTAAGRGRMWKEHGVSRAQTRTRMQEALEMDPVIHAMLEQLYEKADADRSWGA